MIFKRRNPRPLLRAIGEFFWPRGGWRRAATYVLHRMRRLPDSPERICIGIAAGLYVSFLPLYGLHFLTAALVAWIFRGNILAALLGTFYGNPLTFPLMAAGGMELGSWLLGTEVRVSVTRIVGVVGRAGSELMHNLVSVFTGETAQWDRLIGFYSNVYLPYMVGGLLLGLPFAVAAYFVHLPLVRAYQRSRAKRLKARFEAARQRQRALEAGDET
ncbi:MULTISPECIES: DUF2062 domain-containing protein [Pararhodobacter]|uniref:DUF2062 domain-containing protein n=1 Tax=Pararhodobacter aggregans TaxID=404875 RepID=A0A2T7URV3_9RHOB|nr:MULTISPECIES: DUF2062 domain-containing protein [Pararhodobacter]PTX00455.1 hypothetical protein C8N33_110166 [Pararhodobacter aggregans]PVE47427.1 DUF2062 domain-containing protein [Pararhodobacter aggregans]